MGHFGYPAVQRSRERSERQDEQGLARGSFSKNASAASVFAERFGIYDVASERGGTIFSPPKRAKQYGRSDEERGV